VYPETPILLKRRIFRNSLRADEATAQRSMKIIIGPYVGNSRSNSGAVQPTGKATVEVDAATQTPAFASQRQPLWAGRAQVDY
jgi:hypothetical protein